MESAWDKIHYNPVFGKQTDWSFEEYTPQVVIIAIGQNDNHPDDYMKEDYDGEKALHWRSNYEKLLGRIREKYPNAWIICITTLLEHDPAWDRSVEEVCRKIQDAKKSAILCFGAMARELRDNLRIPEAEEMAEELSAYIENLDIEW